ncbi:MAG: alpha-glucan phosphorylase, partial [Verrucomicrobia bacterium]|nr:alpha-glucan phosphorylase [Verrucomicrobiota bacterium]
EPAAQARRVLGQSDFKAARELAEWKHNIRVDWGQIRIDSVTAGDRKELFVGDKLEVSARVFLGKVRPDQVSVQVYVGQTNDGKLEQPRMVDLTQVEAEPETGWFNFRGELAPSESGSYGFSVRVIPRHPNLVQPHELRLITWSK